MPSVSRHTNTHSASFILLFLLQSKCMKEHKAQAQPLLQKHRKPPQFWTLYQFCPCLGYDKKAIFQSLESEVTALWLSLLQSFFLPLLLEDAIFIFKTCMCWLFAFKFPPPNINVILIESLFCTQLFPNLSYFITSFSLQTASSLFSTMHLAQIYLSTHTLFKGKITLSFLSLKYMLIQNLSFHIYMNIVIH